MDPKLIIVLALAISVSFEKIPYLCDLWKKVPKEWKPVAILLICLAIPIAAVVAACRGIDLGLNAVCDTPKSPEQWLNALWIGLLAWLTTQGSYILLFEKLGQYFKDGKFDLPGFLKSLNDEQLKLLVGSTAAEVSGRNLRAPVG